LAATMIGYVYHQGGKNTDNQDLGIKVSHSIGTFFGQLLFGFVSASAATDTATFEHTTDRP
jgi:PHS family inorganic phosphate transporter-like MFS transporter